ncbi:MAG: AMP-binding protein [Gomphosphaeria aponina SAG 52.96 = DSM 107014]|uniref:AMP-binding protein n=1 Tax=Gomphosphaeria aponina SAG 52.96 = DSM 107014 TaxID=1521640 RepID=A0A941JT15_9CHRO|nr:AMP-binding protein [Gomphosphaeria aponina SAG 52.96 = DSM 107014]
MNHKAAETYPPNPQPVLLHQYLLQYAKTTPAAIAIAPANWTYKDLATHSDNYAEILNNCGVACGDRIVLELDPSPEAIALIIACSSLGLVFVPLSPQTPKPRVEQILATTEARLHIRTQVGHFWPEIPQGILQKVTLQINRPLPPHSRSPKHPVLETDLAYIIFTSGTTGQPKGIMMTHRAMLAFFRALVNYCQLEPAARIGTIAPLQFDFSLLDMGLALGRGATLVQVPRNFLKPKQLVEYLDKNQVTQMNSVPSLWCQLLLPHAAEAIGNLQHLKTIFFAGETFSIPHLLHLQSLLPHLRIINCFGQSESIACSFTDVPNPLPPETKNLSIGFAHPGAQMLLLDSQQQEIQEPGKIGEIYLRGATLFSGYWRNLEATKSVLIPNPLRPFSQEKVFRTGDLAYQGSGGELYFVGRRDLQVKIRGNRVELEEIEHRLMAHRAVTAAAVITHNDTLLIAYIVSDPQPTAQELRLFCGETLPNYMIPAEIHYLEALPTTINGKIDRKALHLHR